MSNEKTQHTSTQKSGAKAMSSSGQPNNGKNPLQMPTYGLAPKPTMSNAEAVQAILAREPSIPAAHPDVLSQNMVEGPFSIVELARSLQNNPDLIFEWVYNNIEYLPTFGEAKGALGCLIDGMGNPFDQCELLFALLTQAGFSPSYVLGQIQINATQAAAWLGTSTSSLSYAYNIFNNGGIPVEYVNSNTQLQLTHIWIKVAISGTSYVFDPSFKQYTTQAPINIATATGYNRSTFISQSEVGATVDPGGTFVQNLNRANLQSELTTYATALQNYIQTNYPAARLNDIVGGRNIVQIFAPNRQTSLPYEAPGDVPLIWTAIPNSYRIAVNITFGSINVNLFGSDVHGQRITLFVGIFTGVWTLSQNGTSLGTSSTGGNATLQVTYPYASTFANQTLTEIITPPAVGAVYNYLFGFTFGPVGKGRVDYWQNELLVANAAGNNAFSEPVVGSTLGLLWNSRAAEFAGVTNIATALSASQSIWHHQIGSATWLNNPFGTPTTGVAGFNLNGVVLLVEPLSSTAANAACALTIGLHDGATESLSMQQITGVGAVSPASFIDLANTAGTKIYRITPANKSTLLPLLSGYQSDAVTAYTAQLSAGNNLLIPQTTPQSTGSLSGSGWGLFSSTSFGGYFADVTVTKGAFGSSYCQPLPGSPPPKKPACKSHDPISDLTGDYLYESSDITVGSSNFPYQLEFKSMYDSRLLLTDNAGLGFGWTHNWHATATFGSDVLRGVGSESAVEASATIAEIFVSLDLNSVTTQPVDYLAIIFLSAVWWIDQLTSNAVTVSLPECDYIYALLPDGTYHPQTGDNATFVLNIPNAIITHTTPQQEVRSFSGPSGSFSRGVSVLNTLTFPYGVTINYSYSGPSGALSSVTNNLGRTLTLTYSGSLLSTVTDGTGRTVTYNVNTTTNLLTSTSDPLTNVTTFGYDSSNRLYQYFRPQNPTNAYVTNTYDSLNRVSTQKDVYGNTYTFYFAGSRSAFVDPAGNTEVQYYDSQGDLIQDIDELGNITSYVRDGRGRVSLLTYPEGNSAAYQYDNFNNVLSITYAPKPGSPLANIVNSFTYDPTYNKVHTAVDGKLQTTTYNYDPTTGNLLTILKPAVSGVVPTITKTYNARGQVISFIDETGIQTQNTYDTTTEKLLTTVVNTDWQATVGGTVKVGDVLTITATDALLSGGAQAVTYTVKTGDTLTSIASGLAAAVNTNSNLASVGIVAYSNAAIISLATAAGNKTTYTGSVSTGGTETIALAAGLKLTTTFGYDSVGNVNSIKDALSYTTTFMSDKSRRLTTRTEATPFSYVTMYGYDKNNNLASIERQTGNTMNPEQTYMIAYTLSDKVYTVTDPATNVTTKTYDNFDRLYTVTDAQLKKTTFHYDQRSKLYTVTDPSNTISETRTYTNNGKLYQLSDARTNTTTYSYDGFDRANKTTYADTSFEQNSSYDANNNVLTQLTRSGASLTNTYDPLNRLSTKAPQGQATVTYQYDLSSRWLSATTPAVSGNPATGTFSFAYDTAGRLIQEKTPDSKTVKYGLDKNGNLTELTYPDGYYVTRIYDQLNRLTTIELNGATAAAIGITYDELSRRMVLTYGNGATSTYGFQLNDDLTTLAEAFIGSSVTLTYGFNKVHQETSRAVTDGTYLWHPSAGGTTTYAAANSVNEYPTVGGATYQYDGNGNLKSDGTWTYVYDSAP